MALLEMKGEMASFSPGPILFAFLALTSLIRSLSALLWGQPVPPAPGLTFPIFKITKMPSLVLGEKGSTATLSPCQIFTNGPDEDGTHGIGQNARGRAVLVFIRLEGVVKASRSRKLNGHSQNQPASEKLESDPSQLPWREVGQRESQTRGVID